MKKFLFIVALAGLAYAAWKHWEAQNSEQSLTWAAATDPVI